MYNIVKKIYFKGLFRLDLCRFHLITDPDPTLTPNRYLRYSLETPYYLYNVLT